jgi:hypothetical protein
MDGRPYHIGSIRVLKVKKMRKGWPLGFLGFFFLLGIPGLLTQDWLDTVWLVWAVWFIYFIPEKTQA